MLEEKLKLAIRDVPDFPKKGIMFKDITPILKDQFLSTLIVDEMAKRVSALKPDAIACVEARGFLFGFMLANKLNVPFIPVRKKGKLPYQTNSYEYRLEYGTATVEMHVDAVKPGSRVLIHDDLLATGGTAGAAAELIKMQKGEVAGFAFLINLDFLNGRQLLSKYSDQVISLINY
jgi:adenine phosphoribosyltransferase